MYLFTSFGRDVVREDVMRCKFGDNLQISRVCASRPMCHPLDVIRVVTHHRQLVRIGCVSMSGMSQPIGHAVQFH